MSSLRLRVSLAYVLLTFAALTALGVFVIEKAGQDLRRSQREDLAAQARMVANLLQPLLAADAPLGELDQLAKQLGEDTGTRVTVIAADGSILGDSEADPATMEDHSNRPEVQQALSTGEGSSERRSATVGRVLNYVAVRLQGPQGPVVVRLARPSEGTQTVLADLRASLLLAALAVGGAAAFLGLIISASLLRPLARVGAAAAAIAAGDLAARVRPRPAGEMGTVADAFNAMAETIEAQMAGLSQQRSRLTAALGSSPDAVLALDGDLRVVFANAAAERLLQRPAEEICGRPLAWSLADAGLIEALRRARDSGERQAVQLEQPGRRFFQAAAAAIAGGGDWALLLVIHDVTEVRRAELMRRDFVANVSHELRTPLAALKSVIETLAHGALQDPEAAREFLARADDEVDRLVQLVEELLQLSRIEAGDLPLVIAPVDVAELLAGVAERLRPQAERHGLQLNLGPDEGLGKVAMDAAQMERAVGNLVGNAIKFTPAGGTVTLAARREAEQLVIEVRDTGVGIAAADLPRVFERFYKADHSRASGGSGLGLAIVKHTVEAHGGSVRAESEVGRGSTFSIRIPVSRA